MSEFRGDDLFGSGPHKFSVGRQGAIVVPEWVVNGSGFADSDDALAFDDEAVEVRVRGRLVADDEDDLWDLRQAIVDAAKLVSGLPVSGTLEDNDGREYTGMTLVRYEEAGAVERGRWWSVGYTCLFRARVS